MTRRLGIELCGLTASAGELSAYLTRWKAEEVEAGGRAFWVTADLPDLFQELVDLLERSLLSGALVTLEEEFSVTGFLWEGLVVTKSLSLAARTAMNWSQLGSFPLGTSVRSLYRRDKRISLQGGGRQLEGEELLEKFRKNKQARVALVGESGMGKSYLLRQVAQAIEAEGGQVFEAAFRLTSGGGGIKALLKSFGLPFGIGLGQTPEDVAEMITRYLEELKLSAGILIVCDDCQWADDFAGAVLNRLWDRRFEQVGLIVAGRPDVFFERWSAEEIQRLNPLSTDQLRDLLAIAEPEAEKNSEQICQWAGGNLLLSLELAKAYVRQQRLQPGEAFNPAVEAGDAVALAAQMSEHSCKELIWLSIFAGPLDELCVSEFFERLGLSDWERSTLDSEQLVHTEEGVAFRHELLRLAQRSQLEGDEEIQVHLVAAQLLEEQEKWGDAAYHWRQAEQLPKAAACWECSAFGSAAKGAWVAGGFDAEKALELSVALNGEQRLRWVAGMARYSLGHYEKAESHFSFILAQTNCIVGKVTHLFLGKELMGSLLEMEPLTKPGKALLAEELARTLLVFSEIAWRSHRFEDCLATVLRAHRIALILPEKDVFRLEVEAARAFALSILLSNNWTRRRFADILNRAQEQLSHPSALRIQFYQLLYEMGTENWFEIEAVILSLKESAFQTRERKTYGLISFLEIAWNAFQGKLDKSLALTKQLVDWLEDYGENNLLSLARGTEACLLGETAHPAKGLRLLEENPELKQTAEHEFLALKAGFLYHCGDFEQSALVCRELLETLEKQPMVNYAYSLVLPSWLDATLGLWVRDLLSFREVKMTLRRIRKHGKNFAHSRPLAEGFSCLLGLQAHGAHFEKKFEKAVSDCRKVGMVFHANWLERNRAGLCQKR